MRLKSITLNGFKTFATKTNFEFDDRVTVIVGPNGSGKSNIADAVRWVLGEQSYKLLRGRKTVDMIFHGSDERARAGMAAVTIVFDNSDGWLPIDFSEVSITRRAYRDGKNEYLINGKQVLLRDVNELLGNSGLAERTYTIIGQGLVDAALALNPDERRSLFEEAAGIALYRARQEDAESRLEKTRRNLDRVEDILSELKPRLRSLERQAKRADKFDQVRADLKALMREWYGYHWYRVQEELSQARLRERDLKEHLEDSREKQARLDQELAECQSELQGLRARLNTWHRELSNQHEEREEISREHAVLVERIRSLEKQRAEIDTEIARLKQDRENREDRLETIKREVADLEEEHRKAGANLGRLQDQLGEQVQEKQSLELELEQTREEITRVRHLLSRLGAQKEDRQHQIADKQQQLEAMVQEKDQIEQALDTANQSLEDARQERDQARSGRRAVEDELDQHRKDIKSGERYISQLKEEHAAQRSEISRLQAELDVLKQAEDKLAGYAEGTRVVLEDARRGGLRGAIGALSSNLEVEERLEPAIAAALGEYVDAVVLDDQGAVDRALDMLADKKTRGALLPLDSLTPPDPLSVNASIPGVIGVASNLVEAPPRLQPAVELLLGPVIVVEDKSNISRILAKQPLGTKAVTLRGEVFFNTGQVYAGQDDGATTLSRPRQKRTLQDRLQRLQDQSQEMQANIQNVKERVQRKQDQEDQLEQVLEEKLQAEEAAEEAYHRAVLDQEAAQQQVGWMRSRRDRLQEEIQSAEQEVGEITHRQQKNQDRIESLTQTTAELESRLREMSFNEEREQIAHWRTEVAVTQRALEDARERQKERQQAWEEVSDSITQLKNRKQSLQEELKSLQEQKEDWKGQEEVIEERIREIRHLIDESEEALQKREEEQSQLQKAESRARKSLNQAERSYAQAEVTLTSSQESLHRMQERIREDIGLVEYEYEEDVSGPTPLPFEGYVEKLPRKKSIPQDLESNIKSLRRQMRRLGAVNPEAQDEYHDVQERHQFLTEQLSDLRKAEADTKEVIAELEVLMEREFRKTFNAVAEQFRKIFVRLFGGGEGRLVLTDPDDLSRSGVDIKARLPGRRMQGLSLLSGGERSLTAAALIFSLLKVSPTPFCVLDEVDAMLDESNVARYRELLRELSSETQFIVITHNRNTVQVADVLYGITMAEDMTSRMLSLKLDQVEEVIA